MCSDLPTLRVGMFHVVFGESHSHNRRRGALSQWRYDTLNRLLVGNYGNIDFATAREIITFLAPNRTPGYWTDTLIPNDPMSAVVEGHLVVADLKVCVRIV